MAPKPIQSIQNLGRVNETQRTKQNEKQQNSQGLDFQELLRRAQQTTESLHFSKHVKDRIDQRGLQMDAQRMERLSDAVGLAAQKGVRDSLVLMHDAAYIVNVPSKTVVTAMDRAEAQQRVFTNIDGAVVL